jgi:acetate kinase
MKILVVNAGSSTHKCAIFEKGKKKPLWTGFLDWGKDSSKVVMRFKFENGESKETILDVKPASIIINKLLETSGSLQDLKVIGHRVVHGGDKFIIPTLITPFVKETIKKLITLAPLHNPANLEGIEICEKLFPHLPQVAVFDTAFHAKIPDVACTYPIPYKFKNQGIKRYGFHGISHEYCMKRTLKLLGEIDDNSKMITCHLGNGASLAAITQGFSIDTTMGFTPMEGLMMGTRSGSIDPGIIFYLLTHNKMTSNSLDAILNKESGIRGISGTTSDMREIIKKMGEGDKHAKLSFDMFIYSLNGFIGKMTASLQGLDILVFTAGIGENSPVVREQSCNALKYLGVEIDHKKNENCREDMEISTKDSKVKIVVIYTQEELAIAEKAATLC